MKDNPFPKIEIKEGQSRNDTEITINGKKINGVSKHVIVHEGGKAPVLQLEFPASNMTLDGKMIPELPEVFQNFYMPIHQKDNTKGT